MMTKTDTLLSKSLIEKGMIGEGVLQPLVEEAAKSKDSLFSLLLKKKAVSEENLLKHVSELIRLPLVELSKYNIDKAAIEKVPLKIAEFYKMVPLKLDKRKLTIAVSSPLELKVQDDIRAHLVGVEIEWVLAREREVEDAVKKFYGFAAGTIGEMMASNAQSAKSNEVSAEQVFEKIENIEQLAGDASIAKLVNQIILEAYKKRATDIHIEPYRGKMKLRYRIDGILYDANAQTEMSRFLLPILSRIKIISNLNIVEKRLPQDGRAIVKVEDTQLDLRVSSIPTPYGESVVIRMLPMNRVFDLSKLGLSAGQLDIFHSMIEKPHGIIFITGPTGSGKSTTLYACLNRLNTNARKIITIEDPVEYEMEGVTQIQVMSAIGLDFARGLRSMLRHDPDVMMVGEVRDLETAEIAIRVALTGHLVFSTLHTNDAASGITRLVDVGVEPYLVASSVEAFIAQRLVRLICPDCKEEDKSPAAIEMKKQIIKELGMKKDHDFKIFHGRGCNACNQTGFWGRLAIYEFLLVSEKIKTLIMKRVAASDVKKAAVLEGMRTLRQDGWLKVMAGLTTPEEILKVAEGQKEESDEVLAPIVTAKTPGFIIREEPAPPRSAGDRRIFIRLNDSVNIRYKVVKAAPLPGENTKKAMTLEEFTVTKNISAGGLSFESNESIATGTILELKIELIKADEVIVCLARVVREEEMEVNKKYELAVCFLDLSAKDRSQLDKHVVKDMR